MDSQDTAVQDEREDKSPAASRTDDKAPIETTKTVEVEAKVSDRTEGTKKAKGKSAKSPKKKAPKSKKNKQLNGKSSSSSSSSIASSSDSWSESEDGDFSLTSDSDSDSEDSDSEDESSRKKRSSKKKESHKLKKKSRSKKKQHKLPPPPSSSESESSIDSDDLDSEDERNNRKTDALLKRYQMLQLQQMQSGNPYQGGGYPSVGGGGGYPPVGGGLSSFHLDRGYGMQNGVAPPRPRGVGRTLMDSSLHLDGKQSRKDKKRRHKASKLDYKRVDQVWDSSIHNYKLQDTAESDVDSQYDEFLFHVRRTFDWEGKYKATVVDIKSKPLRDCLQSVMNNIKGVSLVEETPKLDPNMLFLYLEDLRQHLKELKKFKPTKTAKKLRKKERKHNKLKRKHLKVLLKYLDKDYAATKKSLYPMLENGLITFDHLWALWKPGTLAYTSTYGSHDQPRVFKVEVAEKHHSIMRGEYYYIEGKYFEYDGKQHGFGSIVGEIADFRGARKITSLDVYPLQYHKKEAQIREELIERGKKFVRLSGVHYKSHQGMAYYKKKKSVIKVNINGRIMIDPSIHRRINPNYAVSMVRPKDHDILSEEEGSDVEPDCAACSSGEEDVTDDAPADGKKDRIKFVTKVVKNEKGKVLLVRMPQLDDDEGEAEKLDEVHPKDDEPHGDQTEVPQFDEEESKVPPVFSDEEYLIASPVILGFAFAEKLWLEFTVSGVKEIQWNEKAYESLVLEPKTKDIVKALVESHKYHAAESIDDVIQGKGKGLVAVLHGPPGTGKTLTAEGISELLKCPLYMVSAGELGTDSRFLESELQKILDICHAWGAILLLDEADVFLEKRNMHDIHRNALVSIFLRQLEYFQGILFLTTNRVETFDDAFQSRIHIALRYENLDHRAKKAIFQIFLERVRVLEKIDLMPFTDEDLNTLARHELNGRQIKNTIRTAQALAVNKREALSMSHIKQVLDVQMSFDRDLKGGTGYQDAMRSYF